MFKRNCQVLLLLAIVLFTSAAFGADSYARIVRLSDVNGSVQIDRNTGHGFEKAILNMPITQGVVLKTDAGGHAEAEFENGSVLRLTPESSAEFTALSLRDGKRITEIKIDSGTVYVNFRDKGGENFRIWAGNRPLDLTKNAHFRVRVLGDDAEVAVFKGEVNTEFAKVKKNETLRIALNGSSQPEVAKGLTPSSEDDYDSQRTQYLEQYASRNTYNSPYSYGYSDLYRYGSFSNYPGYGMLWRPYGFGPGWDPFSDGYWSYYPGAGYVFLSGYQWGWTPYRYGRWMFVQGYGWAWQPGGWNQWNNGPTVYNPPPTWRTPVAPSGGTSTVVVGSPTQVPHHGLPWKTGDSGDLQGGGKQRPVPMPPNAGSSNQTQPTTSQQQQQQPAPQPNRKQRDLDGDAPVGGKGKQSQPAPTVQPQPQPQPRVTPTPAPAPRPAPAPAPRMEPMHPPTRMPSEGRAPAKIQPK